MKCSNTRAHTMCPEGNREKNIIPLFLYLPQRYENIYIYLLYSRFFYQGQFLALLSSAGSFFLVDPRDRRGVHLRSSGLHSKLPYICCSVRQKDNQIFQQFHGHSGERGNVQTVACACLCVHARLAVRSLLFSLMAFMC